MSDFRLTKIAQFVQVGQYNPGSPGTAKPWGRRVLLEMAFRGSVNITTATVASPCNRAPVGAPISAEAAGQLPVSVPVPAVLRNMLLGATCGGPVNLPTPVPFDQSDTGDLVHISGPYGSPPYTEGYAYIDGLYYGGSLEPGFSSVSFPSGPASVTTIRTVWLYGFFKIDGTPPTPAVYPTFIQQGNYQWNAGGQSVEGESGDFTMSVVVPSDTGGAAVGVAREGDDTALSHQRYGALVQLGRVDAVRNGAVVANITTSRNPADPVTITRRNGQMVVSVGSDEYVWSSAETGTFYLDVSLYRAGDYVHSPSVVGLQTVQPEPAVIPLTTQIKTTPVVTGVVARPQIFAGFRVRSKAVIPLVSTVDTRLNFSAGPMVARVPLVGTADTAQGVNATITLEGFSSESQAGGLSEVIAPMTASALALDTASVQTRAYGLMVMDLDAFAAPIYELSVDAEVGPAIMSGTSFADGDEFFSGKVAATLAPVEINAGTTRPEDADEYLANSVTIENGFLVNVDRTASFGEVFNFDFYVEATLSIHGSWMEILDFKTDQSFSGIASAAWREIVSVRDGSPDSSTRDPSTIGDEGLVTESLKNLDLQTSVVKDTGAATHYTDFDYSHYAQAAGDTYAVKDGKVYRLGTCNTGVPFVYVDFGTSDLGVTQAKRMETMYLGVDTDGTMYAKVDGDGKERVYRVVEQRQIPRVRTAKGIAARTWGLALMVQDPTQIDISNIEFVIRVSTRRWVR